MVKDLSSKQPRPSEEEVCVSTLDTVLPKPKEVFFTSTFAAVWTEQISENLCGLAAAAN